MILYQGARARARATHPQALEMGRQDNPSHRTKQGISFHFLHCYLVHLSPLAPLYLGWTTVLNLFVYAYGRHFTPQWKNATLSYPVTWKQAIEQLPNESKKDISLHSLIKLSSISETTCGLTMKRSRGSILCAESTQDWTCRQGKSTRQSQGSQLG